VVCEICSNNRICTGDLELEERLSRSLAELNLSVRATNCLESEGINTVRDLVVRRTINCYRCEISANTTLQEVRERLASIASATGECDCRNPCSSAIADGPHILRFNNLSRSCDIEKAVENLIEIKVIRTSMFRNMATSLICSAKPDAAAPNTPKVAGRIITTVREGKELRPVVEKLITLGKRRSSIRTPPASSRHRRLVAVRIERLRSRIAGSKGRLPIAPAVALRRRAFAALRSKEAVNILFSELAPRFVDREGGYTRVVRLG